MKTPSIFARGLAPILLGLALSAVPAAFAVDPADVVVIPAASEVSALKDYTYDQRSAFKTTVGDIAAKFDPMIVRLAKRQKGGMEGGADAITIENLQTTRTQLGHQIGRLDDVTPETWVAQRDAVLAALEQTRAACAEAAKTAQESLNVPTSK